MNDNIEGLLVPNASGAYREARQRLYDAERRLIGEIEQVAELRRALPEGPEVPDYAFVGVDGPVRLSQLFAPGLEPYLVMYHLMYWRDDDTFCPMCSGWIDALNGVAHHLAQRVNFVAASEAPLHRLQEWARERGWNRARLLADVGPDLADAIGARDEDGDPVSTVAVFAKRGDRVRHVYSMHPDDVETGNGRGIDLLNPVWHVFDLIPTGRGTFNLRNDYAAETP